LRIAFEFEACIAYCVLRIACSASPESCLNGQVLKEEVSGDQSGERSGQCCGILSIDCIAVDLG
jgi:hypothetical protein